MAADGSRAIGRRCGDDRPVVADAATVVRAAKRVVDDRNVGDDIVASGAAAVGRDA